MSTAYESMKSLTHWPTPMDDINGPMVGIGFQGGHSCNLPRLVDPVEATGVDVDVSSIRLSL